MTKLEESLLRSIIAESSALSDHKAGGELHQYIDNNAEDLQALFAKLKHFLASGGKTHEYPHSA